MTRSSEQASTLAARLRALGLEPVVVPAIELTEPSSFAGLDDALAQLDGFDWVLFTSANAVEVFQRRVKSRAIRAKVAAIGPATARALEAAEFRVELVPSVAVAEAFAEALLPYVRQPDRRATRFLLMRAEKGREELPEALRSAGAEVTIAAAYRTTVPQASIAQIRELFRDPDMCPDVITFTSSSSARNLLALCEAAGVALPPDAVRVSIGPITSETLREIGYPPHAEALSASMESMAQAVLDALAG
ncbi:MAG TPA: uroporphyrinogen-III synthase [Acidobacteriaceae bacterium]